MKTGRVDCECGNQIISNSGKTMNKADDLKKIACWGCGKLYNYDDVERVRVEGKSVTFHPMQIFKMNDCDWWMDINLESAKEHYMAEVGADDDSVVDARELEDKELDDHRFYITDGQVSAEWISFRERMMDLPQVPQFFASTEY